ncbi:Hypothetical_protein [Hexamita inflata]|uniref:Hypothetical_protein n=1 Tax=Hexamita inflata TaxID=28002 RepID=A0AA86NIM5_9EUKA|nr:Hypothetical protein HINF_LOCUS7633 [Hexamita inflata]
MFFAPLDYFLSIHKLGSVCLRGTYHVSNLFINCLEINSEFFQEFSRLLMNSEILTDYNRNNFEWVTILILFVPIMLLFESVVFIKIPSDSNIQINLNSVDHNADVRFSPVFQPVVVVFADFSGLISLSEDSFKEVCKTIVGCYVQLVDLFTVLFVAFLVWFFAQFANFWDWCIPHVVENPVDHVLECRVVHSSTAQQCVPWFRHRYRRRPVLIFFLGFSFLCVCL